MDTLHPEVVWHVGKSGRDVQRQHGAGWKGGCPQYRNLYVDEFINTLTLVEYDTNRGIVKGGQPDQPSNQLVPFTTTLIDIISKVCSG